MRRGRVTHLREVAREVRGELGLDTLAPFDPAGCARLYGIDIVQMSSLEGVDLALTHFASDETALFSGALVRRGSGAFIVLNDFHAPVRQRSTLSHEMAHLLLEHEFTQLIHSAAGCSHERDQEEEADYLGGELLIPFAAAVRLARQEQPDADVAARMITSVQMARWRMNATGARRIATGTRGPRGAKAARAGN